MWKNIFHIKSINLSKGLIQNREEIFCYKMFIKTSFDNSGKTEANWLSTNKETD